MPTTREEALHIHRANQGKLESGIKVPVRNSRDLSLAYSPGVLNRVKLSLKISRKYLNIQ